MNAVCKKRVCACVCAQAIDALKEIFLVALLPDRKLKFFEQQPLAAVPANKEGSRRLLLYYVEDCLKKKYSSFVTGLEECSRDNLEFLKDKALKAMYDLLRSKSEQVKRLRLASSCMLVSLEFQQMFVIGTNQLSLVHHMCACTNLLLLPKIPSASAGS